MGSRVGDLGTRVVAGTASTVHRSVEGGGTDVSDVTAMVVYMADEFRKVTYYIGESSFAFFWQSVIIVFLACIKGTAKCFRFSSVLVRALGLLYVVMLGWHGWCLLEYSLSKSGSKYRLVVVLGYIALSTINILLCH